MKVVNVRTAGKGTYVYIGRKNGDLPQSIFANPFVEGKDGDRTEVIRKYRVWLWGRMKSGLICKHLLALDGKDLGCWCSPLSCHGDVIIRAIEWLKVNGGSRC